jgi:hypothetical protein
VPDTGSHQYSLRDLACLHHGERRLQRGVDYNSGGSCSTKCLRRQYDGDLDIFECMRGSSNMYSHLHGGCSPTGDLHLRQQSYGSGMPDSGSHRRSFCELADHHYGERRLQRGSDDQSGNPYGAQCLWRHYDSYMDVYGGVMRLNTKLLSYLHGNKCYAGHVYLREPTNRSRMPDPGSH